MKKRLWKGVDAAAAVRFTCGLLLLVTFGAPSSSTGSDTWLRVDTKAGILSVMRGDRLLTSFDDIAVGRAGVSRYRRVGDQRTPLGDFRIVKIKEDSMYHRFFIIDYPNEERARVALEEGDIDQSTFKAIRWAVQAGRLPPQNTPLGGNLGIHGLGRGDPRFHQSFNWTQGCVALTNEQIDRLTPWIQVGTRVVID